METLRAFKNFVDELNKDNSRNYKISVLEKYKDDDNVRYFLHYLYSPYITTGISTKKIDKIKMVELKNMPFKESVKSLLDYIAEHNTGTDEVLNYIECFKFAEDMESDLEDLLDKIITKNLILGIEAKTINKAMGKLVEEFNVQLAEKYFESPERIKGKEFAITTKIDGCRIIALKENNEVKFYTRQGQLYEGLVDLEKEIIEKMPDSICLDGELTLLDKGNLDSGEQYKETTKLCRTKDKEKHGLKMLVFDIMSSEEFINQSCTETYTERRNRLDTIFNNASFTYFQLLPILYRGTDTDKITEILDAQVDKGEEGIMLNVCDAVYQFKRTWGLQKCKKFNDTEVEVIGFEEGTNSNKNTLGALVCRYKNNEVRVGSGFTEEERNYIWTHKEEYINQLISVKYFEESFDSKTKKPSLRFPIFKGLRLKEDL